MAWEQSHSASFSARHGTGDTADARRILRSLEHVRVQLEQVVDRLPAEITLVLHPSAAALALSNPLMLARWASTAPSGRRYVTGWVGHRELHVLSPEALRGRRSEASGSREMLRLSAAGLYARRTFAGIAWDRGRGPVIIRSLRQGRQELGWAWHLEGAGRWFAGQTAHARAAIAHRLRDGGRPAFPPGLRDAPLLGGTIFDLLGAREGEAAALALATAPDGRGPAAAIERAFAARFESVDAEWRLHLARLAGSDR
jgi:hypothetical protein